MCLVKELMMKKDCLEHIQNHIFSKLCSWNKSTNDGDILEFFSKEFSHLETLISRTFNHGESNSALLIGRRGEGKSALLNAVLNKLKTGGTSDAGIIVRLNGLLQTDDRLALVEVTRQLNLEAETAFKFASFAENLSHVLQTLNSGSKSKSKPILFILEEFDLFCHHHNQTLLYNLFDTAQSAQAPICVVGSTSRLDVIELLEKRVKSRFSHRQIFLRSDRSFKQYVKIAQSLLIVEDKAVKSKEVESLWNCEVEKLFEDSELQTILKTIFQKRKDVRTLERYLVYVVSQLNDNNLLLTPGMFEHAYALLFADSKAQTLRDLSILQLCLVVAMKHLLRIYDGEPFNFEMVHHEYKKFSRLHSQMTSFERSVVFKAFDQLECLEVIRPVEGGRSSIQRDYRLMQLTILPCDIDKAIDQIPNIPTFLSHWCLSQI